MFTLADSVAVYNLSLLEALKNDVFVSSISRERVQESRRVSLLKYNHNIYLDCLGNLKVKIVVVRDDLISLLPHPSPVDQWTTP